MYPIKEICKVALAGTSMEKFPSMSVVVPLVVPFWITFAPATGPNASLTVPVTLRFCCVVAVEAGAASEVRTM